jgi:hypothetical protein
MQTPHETPETVAAPSPERGREVKSITLALAAPFEANEVKWKPQAVKGNRAMAVGYVDARVIQDRLDDVLGVEGWQDEYELLPDGSVMCKLRLWLGEQWVTKMDVGSPSEQPDGGDRLKAAFSDALKRAAVKFGVGRYLYRLPVQWADYDPQKRQFTNPPTLPTVSLPTKPSAEKPARAKPAPAPKPAASPARPTTALPSDGAELMRRLQDYDTKLADQGTCAKGDLLQHVAQAGVRAGYGADLTAWTGPAIQLAVEQARAFPAHRQTPQKAVA